MHADQRLMQLEAAELRMVRARDRLRLAVEALDFAEKRTMCARAIEAAARNRVYELMRSVHEECRKCEKLHAKFLEERLAERAG